MYPHPPRVKERMVRWLLVITPFVGEGTTPVATPTASAAATSMTPMAIFQEKIKL
jgi:hypothetical protein